MFSKTIASFIIKGYKKDIARALDVAPIPVVAVNFDQPGMNGIYYSACPFSSTDNKAIAIWGNPAVLIDSRYFAVRYLASAESIIAHEYRHRWQNLNDENAFNFELVDWGFVGHWSELDFENPSLYSWHEVDARAWADWYVNGQQGEYVVPVTDKELWEQAGYDRAVFRQLVIERYESHPKLEMEWFGKEEEDLLEIGEFIASIAEERKEGMAILELTEEFIVDKMSHV